MGEGLRPSKSEMGQKDRKRERQKAAAHLSPSACNSSDTMSLKNTAGICSKRERERDGGQHDKHRLVQLFT
ncbi:hypothetical protein ABG768_003422, partial [Culter alburnus]